MDVTLTDLVRASAAVGGHPLPHGQDRGARGRPGGDSFAPAEVETATFRTSPGCCGSADRASGWRSLARIAARAGLPRPASPSPRCTTPSMGRSARSRAPAPQEAVGPTSSALFGRATADEQRYLRGLVTGELRQGALDG